MDAHWTMNAIRRSGYRTRPDAAVANRASPGNRAPPAKWVRVILPHGEQPRPDDSVSCDATEFLAQRFPGPHQHALQEFGIFRGRLIRRHRQAAPKWRVLAGRRGVEPRRVIVTHVNPIT